ncbi:MAG: serine/threonine-protein kinase PknK, partial [Anaerolineae bacterium]|nr:serine/threonine-protein kinase PknK [Anaerolineae bacterium]
MDFDDFTGRTIRGYELREQIGYGGFGAVYRAYQASVDREVAIKIILPHHTRREAFVRQFEIEARLIARLEHVHIVPLYDFWHEPDGNAYIVMRYLRGGSLRAMLRHQPIPFDLMGRVLRQIAEALALAHENHIIHRDIKPDNILFDEQTNAYLSDFGIAKDLVSKVDLGATPDTLGSPAYAAPEQFFRDHPIASCTDVYSLGMTLFEALAGAHPFPRNHIDHLRKQLPSLRALRDNTPPLLDAVLARATSKDQEGRYPNPLALADAYDEALIHAAQSGAVHPTPVMVPDLSPDQARTKPDLGAEVPMTGEGELATLQMFGKTPLATSHHPAENGEQTALLITEARHLPARAFRLVGRDVLVEQIEALVEQNQQILVHGMAGIGKTALVADVVARRLAAGQGPALWLRAGHQDAPALIEALVRPFDDHFVVTPTNLQLTPVRDLLSAHNIRLIVLDNTWHDAALQAVLEVLPSDIPVIVTSRQRYALRRIVTVDELDLFAALDMLSDHAGIDYAADVDANNLCRLLGYHPFALELAGRTIQVDELTPGELMQRIGGEPHTLGPL